MHPPCVKKPLALREFDGMFLTSRGAVLDLAGRGLHPPKTPPFVFQYLDRLLLIRLGAPPLFQNTPSLSEFGPGVKKSPIDAGEGRLSGASLEPGERSQAF